MHLRNRIVAVPLVAAGLLLGSAAARADASTAADQALYQAAKMHLRGETPAAVAIWKKWAQQGNADAAYNLAVIHQYADGVPYDADAALRWYRQAAEHGDKASQFQLGLMYLNGEGVPADAAKAQEWFTRNRRDHMHHQHRPQFLAWQQQARQMIEERDRRETYAASRRAGEQVVAELRRRAGMLPEAAVSKLAAAEQETSSR